MFLIIIFFFLIVSYQTTLALTYNDTCTKKCDFPGMICINNQCICDSKQRLFWTNARCAPCPNDWMMTETACIAYHETEMSWKIAKLTCRQKQAELISFRNRDLISLIYNATNKQKAPSINGAWTSTSAHATDLSEFGKYQWLDRNVNSFDNRSDWWCKKITLNLGYKYPYNEPTRNIFYDGTTEACVIYWRGKNKNPPHVICLDDQHCSIQFPFVCERSESTEYEYQGPPPMINNLSNGSTIGTTKMSTIHIHYDEPIIINTDTTTNIPKAKKKSNDMIKLMVVSIILFLLALLGGLFFYFKRHNPIKTQLNTDNNNKLTNSFAPKITDIPNKDELVQQPQNKSEDGLVLDSNLRPVNFGIDLDTQKQEKNKRGGYSKQQFNEFD